MQQHPGGWIVVHREDVVQYLQRGSETAALHLAAQAPFRCGSVEDRRRHELCRDEQPGPVQGEGD